MELKLVRSHLNEKDTRGELYLNGKFFCNTLEDKDRMLNQAMTIEQIKSIKVYGETAIPSGKYQVGIQYWGKHQMYVPCLRDVPGFTGILIHNGVSAKDTLGCIIVGTDKNGAMVDGKLTMISLTKLINHALLSKEEVTIEIGYPLPVSNLKFEDVNC